MKAWTNCTLTGASLAALSKISPDSQRFLISRIGSDPAVQDPSRVMRLPGFYHQKRKPRMTRILEVSGVAYNAAEFRP
jgi:hypothetical protein